MIAFKRDTSGLYLADQPATARVAFLFQDPSRTDPTFDLTGSSWVDPGSLGFVAFFLPSATRDWQSLVVLGVIACLFALATWGPAIW